MVQRNVGACFVMRGATTEVQIPSGLKFKATPLRRRWSFNLPFSDQVAWAAGQYS